LRIGATPVGFSPVLGPNPALGEKKGRPKVPVVLWRLVAIGMALFLVACRNSPAPAPPIPERPLPKQKPAGEEPPTLAWPEQLAAHQATVELTFRGDGAPPGGILWDRFSAYGAHGPWDPSGLLEWSVGRDAAGATLSGRARAPRDVEMLLRRLEWLQQEASQQKDDEGAGHDVLAPSLDETRKVPGRWALGSLVEEPEGLRFLLRFTADRSCWAAGPSRGDVHVLAFLSGQGGVEHFLSELRYRAKLAVLRYFMAFVGLKRDYPDLEEGLSRRRRVADQLDYLYQKYRVAEMCVALAHRLLGLQDSGLFSPWYMHRGPDSITIVEALAGEDRAPPPGHLERLSFRWDRARPIVEIEGATKLLDALGDPWRPVPDWIGRVENGGVESQSAFYPMPLQRNLDWWAERLRQGGEDCLGPVFSALPFESRELSDATDRCVRFERGFGTDVQGHDLDWECATELGGSYWEMDCGEEGWPAVDVLDAVARAKARLIRFERADAPEGKKPASVIWFMEARAGRDGAMKILRLLGSPDAYWAIESFDWSADEHDQTSGLLRIAFALPESGERMFCEDSVFSWEYWHNVHYD